MIIAIGAQSLDIDLISAERDLVKLEGTQATGKPTLELLDRVQAWLASKGVTGATRSVAWQVWWSIFERIEDIRQQTEVAAELAYWYGVNPFTLTDEQQVGLRANLVRVRAQQTLHDGNYRETDYDSIYKLVLAATGDETLARKAWAQAREKYQDRKTGLG